jgi:hypothetical protein
VLPLKKIIIGLGLLLVLLGCSAVESIPPTPIPTRPPLATIRPTRGALITNTPLLEPALIPSATPDATLLSEVFMEPTGFLSFRYPFGWSIIDDSDEVEVLVRAESSAETSQTGFFVVNLLNVQGEITNEGLLALADTYLGNLFAENLADIQVSYREEGNSLVAAVISTVDDEEPFQFELRFLPRPPFYQVMILGSKQANWNTSLPLLDAMARSVAIEPELGSEISMPDVAAIRLNEGLSVQNGSMYQAKTGALFVVGEVLNSSAQAYEDVLVTVSLLDSNAKELAHQRWRIQRQLLPVGERSPFVAIFNPLPEGVSTFYGTAEALPADFYSKHLTTAFETTVTTSPKSALATYTLSGQVSNPSAARQIKLIAALYDAEGRVIAVTSSTLEADILPSGEQLPFVLNFYNKAESEITRHEIWVEGVRVQE